MAKKSEADKVSRWEWVLAGVSTLLLISTISYLLVQAFSSDGGAPAFSISIDSVRRETSGYVALLKVQNLSDRTVADLNLKGVLLQENGASEERSVAIDFVPAHGHTRAGLIFQNDPRRGRLRITPEGYKEP